MRNYWMRKTIPVDARAPYIKYYARRKAWVSVRQYDDYRSRINVIGKRYCAKDLGPLFDQTMKKLHKRSAFPYATVLGVWEPGTKMFYLITRHGWKRPSEWQLARIKHTWPPSGKE